ncbi:hypothetical protein ACLB2K_051228 [Fragaria x ananassa]
MTYEENVDRREVVSEIIVGIGGGEDDEKAREDYVKLRHCPEEEAEAEAKGIGIGWLWYWVRLVLLFMCLGLLAGVFIKWVGPFLMDKEVIPMINWETKTFSPPVLAILVFASVALFPTILIPSSPSMWVAGMTFGYGYGFLLIISAAAIGISLPYFISYLFFHKIQGWLEKYPKRASILRSAGEGNWFHQFRAVTLIRISPFPYIIYNYCAVATNVKYGPYLFGSLAGMVPETFVALYTGILIRTLADASHEHHGLSAPQIIFSVVGFALAVATTIFFTVYAKKQLKELQKEDEPLLQ